MAGETVSPPDYWYYAAVHVLDDGTGTVQHERENAEYFTAPADLVERARTDATRCDRCNLERVRHTTHLVRIKGVDMQVGGACWDISRGIVDERVREHIEAERNARAWRAAPGTGEFVRACLAALDAYGWNSGTNAFRAREDREWARMTGTSTESTKDVADEVLRSAWGDTGRHADGSWQRAQADAYEKVRNAEVAAAIEWGRAQGGDEVADNIAAACAQERALPAVQGVLAWACEAYRRSLMEALPPHSLEPGKRHDVTGRVVSVSPYESHYGTSYRVALELDGATATWWASRHPGLQPGDAFQGRVSVKPSGKLTRCTLKKV